MLKSIGFRTVALGALCASFIGVSALASADGWNRRDRDRHEVVIHRPVVSFGIGLTIGATCAPPLYVDRCDPVVVVHDRYWRDNDRRDRDRRVDRDRRDDRRGRRY